MTYMYFVTLQIIKRQSVSGKYNVSVKLTYIILFIIEQTQLFKINVNKTLWFPVDNNTIQKADDYVHCPPLMPHLRSKKLNPANRLLMNTEVAQYLFSWFTSILYPQALSKIKFILFFIFLNSPIGSFSLFVISKLTTLLACQPRLV